MLIMLFWHHCAQEEESLKDNLLYDENNFMGKVCFISELNPMGSCSLV